MEFDRFLLGSGESGESGGGGLLPPGLAVDLCFLTKWKRANSQVPPLDADLQTEAAGTLSEPLDSGWLQVTRRRRHQGSSRLCFVFFDGVSQKEESPWRGINRKERLFVDDELEA